MTEESSKIFEQSRASLVSPGALQKCASDGMGVCGVSSGSTTAEIYLS